MNGRTARKVVLLFALPLTFVIRGSAASLTGKVTEVVNGDPVIVTSLNHPVKVKLVGVAAPEQKQAYFDVAMQHLKDLALEKVVIVRYSLMDHDGFLVGRLLISDQDIGQQMIRDGVAWYDKGDSATLTDELRQLYDDCQQAARTERRGLWQDKSPVAPWDFRNALAAAKAQEYSYPLPRPQSSRLRHGTPSGLSTNDLLGNGLIGAGTLAGRAEYKPLNPNGRPGEWMRFEPEDHHFSISVPADGFQVRAPVLDSGAQIVNINQLFGYRDGTYYGLIWLKRPQNNDTDETVAAEVIKGITDSLELQVRTTFKVTPGAELHQSFYGGREYRLSNGSVTLIVRVLSRQLGTDREAFVLVESSAFNNASPEFFNSFKIKNY